MKTWDTVTHEDLIQEIIPGVTGINSDMVNKLNYISYLAHISELIKMGINKDASIVREHFEDLFTSIYIEQCRALKDIYPEPDEISKYMHSPSTHDAIDRLVIITIQLDESNWKGFKDKFCIDNGLDPMEIE